MVRRKGDLMTSKYKGLTLIELLIVVSILALLMVTAAFSFQLQRKKGFDARRKADLAKLKIALEDYYNDRRCYPTAAVMSHCDLADLQPYLEKVPCDPLSHQPYGYTTNAACTYFGVFTTLQDTNDPIISQLGCSPTCFAGKSYNYGVTNSGQSLSVLAGQAQ